MSLKQRAWLSGGVIAGGIVIVLVSGGDGLWGSAGVLLVIAGLVLDVVLVRCPHCGTWLGRHGGGCCQSCGAEIDWDQISHS